MASDNMNRSILLFLGEGNFSFSAALSASPSFSSLNCHLIATDYVPELENKLTDLENDLASGEDSRGGTSFNMTLLKDNVKSLKSRGHTVLLDVDATKLHEHEGILSMLNDANVENISIIFNFPHVKSKKMKIGLNRDLLRDFFISCDKLAHCLNTNEHQKTDTSNCAKFSVNVSPVVSLCAGQSGIAEVESVSRCWGDTWQINDMAAHGNFICTSICKFTDWNLSSIVSSNSEGLMDNFKPAYQSSYYRLQTGVSFTTDNALTLTYSHKCHIDPETTDRMKSIFKIKHCSSAASKIIADFVNSFGPILNEEIVMCTHTSQDYYNHQPPYHLGVLCQKDVKRITKYLEKIGEKEQLIDTIHVVGNELQIKKKKDSALVTTLVGNICTEEEADDVDKDKKNTMTLYVDQLLELKYDCDYRFLLSNDESSAKSLYPHIHEFHISFWVINQDADKDGNGDSKTQKQNYSKDMFIQILLDVYGLMLKALDFVEEYVDSNRKRKSLCWRVQVQSVDQALSRLAAHQMYLQLRKQLSARLNVEVR